MMIDLTAEERQFLRNVLIDVIRDEAIPRGIFNKLLGNPVELTVQEVGFTQSLMQELGEIHGRRSSTANEKQSVTSNPFIPQRTLQLVKSIGTKLGANLPIDVETKENQLSPRSEGSTWIMTDVTKPHLP